MALNIFPLRCLGEPRFECNQFHRRTPIPLRQQTDQIRDVFDCRRHQRPALQRKAIADLTVGDVHPFSNGTERPRCGRVGVQCITEKPQCFHRPHAFCEQINPRKVQQWETVRVAKRDRRRHDQHQGIRRRRGITRFPCQHTECPSTPRGKGNKVRNLT